MCGRPKRAVSSPMRSPRLRLHQAGVPLPAASAGTLTSGSRGRHGLPLVACSVKAPTLWSNCRLRKEIEQRLELLLRAAGVADDEGGAAARYRDCRSRKCWRIVRRSLRGRRMAAIVRRMAGARAAKGKSMLRHQFVRAWPMSRSALG